ncbi:MAG: LacI family DNA-binding transcriptional regulator [Clostridiales bacterium]|nr:LacI family DNA-binding transcriptional regulator [Clostridiales bacterium]
MVSMKDIARACEVSVATVSKALNNQSDIGEDTRKRICQMAKDMGYYTNSSARALKTNRTYNIGVLFVDEMNSGLAHEYFSSVLDSLKSTAENHGYDITFISHNVKNENMTYLQHAKYRGVDGVVIACVNFHDPQVVELIESDVPTVTIDHSFNNRVAVISDNVRGMEELVTYIVQQGHTRIAFIHGEPSSVTENRLIGFHRACQKAGIEIPDEYLRAGTYHDAAKCEKITKELLELPNLPTCIIFPDDYSGLGGMNAIKESGLKIPDDISVAGYDGIHLSSVISPKLTTYKQDTLTLGSTAAERLVDLIENPKTALLNVVVISGELQTGESVAKLS